MPNGVEQIQVVSQGTINPSQGVTQAALFKTDGTAFGPLPLQTAAQTDVGAVTSTVAAGATPTKAEFDALRVDVLANRTVINSLLAKMRTSGALAP